MRNRATVGVAVSSLLLLAAGGASSQGLPVEVEPDGSGCTHSFTSSQLKWCVNKDGNLQQFESPAGAEHIDVGGRIEGYILCVDGDLQWTNTAVQDNFQFQPPQVLAGPTSSSITIRRVTFSGRWIFDQKWSRDTTERDLTLQMTLENAGPPANNVRLLRVVDIDANGTAINAFDASRYSAVFRNTDAVAVTALTLNENPSVEITTSPGITWCDPPNVAVPGSGADAKAYVIYDLGNLTTGRKKTVKISYRAL